MAEEPVVSESSSPPRGTESPWTTPDFGRLIAGVTIIALGVLLLLDRSGALHWADRTGWWPILIIVFGLTRFTWGRRGLRTGVAFILIGVWGVLNEYGVLQYETSWPLLLVIGGGALIAGSVREPRPVTDSRAEFRRRPRGSPVLWLVIMLAIIMSVQRGSRREVRADAPGMIQRSAVLGESRTVSYDVFRGGEWTAVMGTCELDLTHTTIEPGADAIANVFVLMGQVRLRVPEGWIVDARAVPALGGIADRRLHRVATTEQQAESPTGARPPRLVLRGSVVMGTVLIRD